MNFLIPMMLKFTAGTVLLSCLAACSTSGSRASGTLICVGMVAMAPPGGLDVSHQDEAHARTDDVLNLSHLVPINSI